jgi:preprotein translocase subunit SecA
MFWGRRRAADRIAEEVGAFEDAMRALTDDELGRRTERFRARLADEPLDALLAEALAAGREAGRRVLGQRAGDAQIAGAAAMCRGRLVEMKTGEGKTLAVALAAYVWSLPNGGVHVITANDYLVERDAEWMRPLYEALGASCALVVPGMETRDWVLAYRADITYVTTSAAASDYLLNHAFKKAGERLQRPLRRAIVDEADLLLIDDAEYYATRSRTIEADEFFLRYRNMAATVARLDPDRHCIVDPALNMVTLNDAGVAWMEDELGVADLYQSTEPELQRALDDSLRARFGYHRDHDYVVVDGVVSQLNRNTGRVDQLVRLPDGLFQAIEIKEGLDPSPLRQVTGEISHRGLLRLYPHLAAATGTAVEERLYREAYGLRIERIPTHRPVLRVDHAPLFYATETRRTKAALDRIAERRATGRPVLVVTGSIAQCTQFSAALRERGIPHEVLTANNHRQEAEIISRAGRVGTVTLVTRMAGRGVDIRLGGDDPDEHAALVAAGGLYVLGFELTRNRRLELHMRGRAGRRGDPGESDVLLSMEDPFTASMFTETARRRMAPLVKDEPFDSAFLLARAVRRGLDRATQDLELRTLDRFRVNEIQDRQMEEVYRLRDAAIDGHADPAPALDVIDRLWGEHLVALRDVRAETTLHGLTGAAWEARYRQEANRLLRALRARIEPELTEAAVA